MYIALICVILFLCVLLILVVLSQNSKGGGLSSQFGGGGTSQLMGVKRTGDLLEKLTWGFAIGIMVLSLSSHMLVSDGNEDNRSVNELRTSPVAPALPQQAPLPQQEEAAPAPAPAPAEPAN